MPLLLTGGLNGPWVRGRPGGRRRDYSVELVKVFPAFLRQSSGGGGGGGESLVGQARARQATQAKGYDRTLSKSSRLRRGERRES